VETGGIIGRSLFLEGFLDVFAYGVAMFAQLTGNFSNGVTLVMKGNDCCSDIHGCQIRHEYEPVA
jgi:hypothetical protein